MSTGTMIKERRNYLRLTQKELAEQLYVTQQTVSKWENDNIMPDIKMLESISTVLGYHTCELLNGKKNKDIPSPVKSITNVDTNESFGIVSVEGVKKWIRKNRDKYVIKVLYGFSVHYWTPKENEYAHIIMP